VGWGRFSAGVGLFSIGPTYQFLRRSGKSKLVPFVDGGYTLGFASGATPGNTNNLINFGAGLNYWFHKRVGLRLDFKDYLYHRYSDTANFPAIRVGLVFR
jgi:hypothetical protein